MEYRIEITVLKDYVDQTPREDLILDVVMGVDLPAALVDLPFWMWGSDKDRYKHIMDFRVRRALIWPFLGIPFWWSAGRGVEALVAARRSIISPRIRWSETTIGILFFVIFTIFAVGSFSDYEMRHDRESWPLMTGAALWALLAANLLIARIMQRRIRRRSLVATEPDNQRLRWNTPKD